MQKGEQKMGKITVIEATINPLTQAPILSKTKRRVAAYARVSTEQEEQESSYEAQVNYYTDYIQSKDDWKFVKVYADEGISGTSTKFRKGFQDMIKDALDGKIDLILTKSISRFARNTLDTISKIRELKEHKVEVYFEKENIWSFDSKSELVLTIMASIAQEESRSISQNVTWGKRAAMKKGKVSMTYSRFVGFKKGVDGKITIDDDEALIVKKIYSMFLEEGMTSSGIAQELNAMGPITSKRAKWSKNNIDSILKNEKYKGCALLQKGYVENYLDHKVVKNNGELDMYYVENSHPAIISPEEWDMVQMEMERRDKLGRSYSSVDPFASKLVCGECCGLYGRKTWHSTSKYKSTVYQCNSKFEKRCRTPNLTEEDVKKAFLEAYIDLMDDRAEIISNLESIILETLSTEGELAKIEDLKSQLVIIDETVKKMIDEKSKTADYDEEKFNKKYSSFETKFNKIKKEIEELELSVTDKNQKVSKVKSYIRFLGEQPSMLPVWDKKVWMLLVDKAVVNSDKIISFTFFDGSTIKK
jgi:DNA invertase Pin-like site-specific DNA recombinase